MLHDAASLFNVIQSVFENSLCKKKVKSRLTNTCGKCMITIVS